MKMVKATERLPKLHLEVIARNFRTNKVAVVQNLGHDVGFDVNMSGFPYSETEWLDESPSSDLQHISATAAKHFIDHLIHFGHIVWYGRRLEDIWKEYVAKNKLSPSSDPAEVLVKALEHIANPIAKLRKDAEEAGAVLDGYCALMIAESVPYLRRIATEALSQYEQLKQQ